MFAFNMIIYGIWAFENFVTFITLIFILRPGMKYVYLYVRGIGLSHTSDCHSTHM